MRWTVVYDGAEEYFSDTGEAYTFFLQCLNEYGDVKLNPVEN